MILDREAFAKHFNTIKPGLGDPDSVLWSYEQWMFEKECAGRAQWFVKSPPLQHWQQRRDQYWEWCDRFMRGTVICFSVDDQGEWWGFQYRDDIPLWIVRWF